MSNFTHILDEVIEYSGLVNRKDFVTRLLIATLNDLHRSRKWYKDIIKFGWSYDEEKAKAAANGTCPIEPPLELTFEIGLATLLKVVVCDFEGNQTELVPDVTDPFKDLCVKKCSTKPNKVGYQLSEDCGVYTVKGCRPISKMVVQAKREREYTRDDFDSSWIVKLYGNTITYSVVADVTEDTGLHNTSQWLGKARHAIAHLHATEKHYP